MKEYTHRFIVEVKTTQSLKSAKYAILAAFAKRDPDGCEFKTMPHRDYVRRLLMRVFEKV